MKTHEIAKLLLEQPDQELFVIFTRYDESTDMSYTYHRSAAGVVSTPNDVFIDTKPTKQNSVKNYPNEKPNVGNFSILLKTGELYNFKYFNSEYHPLLEYVSYGSSILTDLESKNIVLVYSEQDIFEGEEFIVETQINTISVISEVNDDWSVNTKVISLDNIFDDVISILGY